MAAHHLAGHPATHYVAASGIAGGGVTNDLLCDGRNPCGLGTAVLSQQQYQHHLSLLDAEYYPTDEECDQMARPIADLLTRCICYDMLGTSTQVVVVDSSASLKIPFIAAQETRLNSCVIWDVETRRFSGVLSSSDYLQVLLHCHKHPDQVDKVASMSVREWKQKFPRGSPVGIVSVYTDMSLKDCLQKMYRYNIRRVIALAPKEEGDVSVVASVHFGQITEYLGAVFFSIESATCGKQPVSNSAGNTSGIGYTNATNSASGKSSNANASFPLSGATAADLGASEGRGLHQSSGLGPSSASGPGFSGSLRAPSIKTPASSADMTLPLHVRNILASAQAEGGGEELSSLLDLGPEAGVGPYHSIFDIPFSFVPKLGKHRRTPLFVTMSSTLVEAITTMISKNVQSIAVCTSTEDLTILDVISRSDLMRMEVQGDYDITITVREALRNRFGTKVYVFHERDSLRDIFVHFVRSRMKELYLVDPDTDKLLGQISIAELIKFLVFGQYDAPPP